VDSARRDTGKAARRPIVHKPGRCAVAIGAAAGLAAWRALPMSTTIVIPVTAWTANGNFNPYGDPVVNSDTGPKGGITIVPPNTPFTLADDENALNLVALFGGTVLEGPS